MTPKKPLDFSQSHPVWSAINGLAVKVIPPLMVACVVVITSGAWATYNSVSKLIDKTSQHDTELAALKAEIKGIEAASVKRQELLDILKRVEQQMEIALLRSGVKLPPKMLSSESSNDRR